MPHGDDKPITNIVFTDVEAIANAKIQQQIIQGFYKSHPELTAAANSDMLNMMRDDKQAYVNMAIKYAVDSVAAFRKAKDMKV
jgi:phenolic acid decarboxylase